MPVSTSPRPAPKGTTRALAGALALLLAALAAPAWLGAEGSRTLYPDSTPSPSRANIEWRTTFYGSADSPAFNIFRRTLLKLYVEAGEQILVGSSGVDVASSGVYAPGDPDAGDIRIYNPGVVTGAIGGEAIPALAGSAAPPQPGAFANGFSCLSQRDVTGESRGRIGSRAQELAGPNTPNNLQPAGYTPCAYTAPVTGIYDVVFTGPAGDSSNENAILSGALEPSPADFGPNQRTSVTAWDVSVRKEPAALATEPGRLFTYYFAGNTGGGGRTVISQGYVVTDFGFVYRVRYAGDPYGFVVYANQFGFQDTDGSPLYRAILADPDAPTQDQNELKELQGGVRLLPPEYPIFFGQPYGPALDALAIPRQPVVPSIAALSFTGSEGPGSTRVERGGTFSFRTTQPGVYTVVVSPEGGDFDPANPRNRLLRGIAAEAGPVSITWDGTDNSGEPFAVGRYRARAVVQGGEVHFPFLDVENNTPGGPLVELTNPPDATGDGLPDCPPWNGGCFGAFYDDSSYRTAEGTLIGTAVGGPLCPGGVGNPPDLLRSDSQLGYDTRTPQRAFGFPFGANPDRVCQDGGGFGDKKALDLWTFYPSNQLVAPLQVVAPTAITLRGFSAERGPAGVTVRWETGSELNSAGFHLLRAPGSDRAAAVRITPRLILATGGPAQGAAYSWVDSGAEPGQNYSYWLQETETDGRVNEYGPVAAGPAPATGPTRVWLPLVSR
jgi:hypothetical protein